MFYSSYFELILDCLSTWPWVGVWPRGVWPPRPKIWAFVNAIAPNTIQSVAKKNFILNFIQKFYQKLTLLTCWWFKTNWMNEWMACAYLFKIQMSEYYHFHSTDDVLYKNSKVVIPCSFPPIRFMLEKKKHLKIKKRNNKTSSWHFNFLFIMPSHFHYFIQNTIFLTHKKQSLSMKSESSCNQINSKLR